MSHRPITYGISAAIGLLVTLVAIVSGLGFYHANQSHKAMTALADLAAHQANAAIRLEVDLMETLRHLDRYQEALQRGGGEHASRELEFARLSLAEAETRYAQFSRYAAEPHQPHWELVQRVHREYAKLVAPGLQTILTGGERLQVTRQHRHLAERYGAFSVALDDFVSFAEQRADAIIAESERFGYRLGMISLGLLLMALLVYLAVRTGLSRIVASPLLSRVDVA